YRTMGLGVREERLAYPPEVAAFLFVDRHAGIDPGVDEQVISDPDHVLERFEKGDVLRRHERAQQLLRVLELGLEELRAIDPVTERGLAPTVAQEVAEDLELVEAPQEHFLVVAGEDAHAPPRLPFAGERDDLG